MKVGFKGENTEQDKKGILYNDKPSMCAPKLMATKHTNKGELVKI